MDDRAFNKLLGELEQRIPRETSSPVDFSCFLGRPVDFAEQICQAVLLRWQAEALNALVAHDRLSIATANSAGKTGGFIPAALLYWVFVLGGTALYLTSTEKQSRQQIIRELKRWLGRSAALSCDVYQHGLELANGGAIYTAAPGSMEAAAGHHGQHLLVIVDEASHLQDDVFESLTGNVVAAGNKLVLSGNPLRMEGPFARTQRIASGWWRRQVTAFEIIDDPNAPLIPGLIDRAGLDSLRQIHGEESSAFQSRAWARLPSTPTDAIYPTALIEEAVERWHKKTLLAGSLKPFDLGIDVAASEDGDETIVAVTRNGHVLQLLMIRERDTMVQVRLIDELCRRLGIATQMPVLTQAPDWLPQGCPDRYNGVSATLRVDEIGLGKGLLDRLAELGYATDGFNAARRCKKERDATLYANERARVAYNFREALIQQEIALPPDELLLQELKVYSAFTNASGKLQVMAKEDIRQILGRSCDRLDSVLMACCGEADLNFGRAGLGGPLAF